ncbi:PAS domain S-box protein [Deinococcus sp. 6YEL10]|uniref:PAS domain S-box protein n=1 Tax=Deinococcus sp. 6YEL10 TaxID=2745870 RepID=UPI001E4F11F5|nr:PAS domain S-box protein [Deinococcus sp. 6YEL10]MCD0161291.1 PAS domain S-box protein [Deinococcus sp. 6YEL10]
MRPGLLELRWAYGLFALLILESFLLAWLAPRPVVWALLPPVLLTLGVAAWLAPRLVAMLRGHRELKESYAQELGFARQIMETVEHGLTVSDEDGRFVYVNPAYARMLGLTPEQVVGRSPFEWTLPEDQERLRQARARRLSGESSSYMTRLRRADGSLISVVISGSPRWQGGRIVGNVAAVVAVGQLETGAAPEAEPGDGQP